MFEGADLLNPSSPGKIKNKTKGENGEHSQP